MRPEEQPYKMSFVVGGLALTESVEVAQLRLSTPDWDETIARAMSGGVMSLPKAASRHRSLREIVNRLSQLDIEELAFFVGEADRTEQQALLWLASCRVYRFMREFAVEVLQERFLSYQLDLPLESFDILLEAKAEWNEGLSNISRSTQLKLRQVMFRMMREASVINSQNQIQQGYLTTRLKSMIQARNPAELAYFPGLAHEAAT